MFRSVGIAVRMILRAPVFSLPSTWRQDIGKSLYQKVSKPKTAFVTPFGAWQFKVLPFGLKNAPAVFQRTMDAVLAGVKWVNCLVYIDDVLIYSKSFDEHILAIEEVFDRLIKCNFKLKPSKCDILKPELLFLGHLISAKGLQPNPSLLLRRNKHYLKENKMNLSQQVKNTSYHKELSRWISKKYLKE